MASFADGTELGAVWRVLYRFLDDDPSSETSFDNREWWGFVEVLAPVESALTERVNRGEPIRLDKSPGIWVQNVFDTARDGRKGFLVVEAPSDTR